MKKNKATPIIKKYLSYELDRSVNRKYFKYVHRKVIYSISSKYYITRLMEIEFSNLLIFTSFIFRMSTIEMFKVTHFGESAMRCEMPIYYISMYANT